LTSLAPSFGISVDEAISSLECSLDGADYAPCTDTPSFTLLGDGSHSLDVRATDLALPVGNVGTDSVSWVTDTSGGGEENNAPVAVDDGYETDNATALTVDVASNGVLGNDSDLDLDTLTAVLDTEPSHGTLDPFGSDGTFVYAPDSTFVGTDTFTYHASDGTDDSNSATVSIDVADTVAPEAADHEYAVVRDGTLSVDAPGLLADLVDPDVGPDGWFVADYSNPDHGSIDTLDAATGAFGYTPDTGFTGDDTFTYSIGDGEFESDSATVTIHVVPSCTTEPVDLASGSPDTIHISTGGGSGAPVGGCDPAITFVVQNVTTDPQPAVIANPNGTYGSLPDASWIGVTDDQGSGNFASNHTTNYDTTFELPSGYTDPSLSITLLADNAATVLLNGNQVGQQTQAADPSNFQSSSTFSTPEGSFFNEGTNTLEVQVADFTGPNGLDYSADVSFCSSECGPTDQAPQAADDNYETPQGTQLVVTAPGVLVNDSDPDATIGTLARGPRRFLATDDALEVSPLSVGTFDTDNGSVDLSADGSFAYTPDESFAGEDTFTYTATDGILDSDPATVTVDVTAPPEAVPIHVTLTWGDGPSDLDLHVITPDSEADDGGDLWSGNPCHPSGDSTPCPAEDWGTLDDSGGDPGLEEATIGPSDGESFFEGMYKISVDNFSCDDATFEGSFAHVTVTQGDQTLGSYDVGDAAGLLSQETWSVAKFDVAADGTSDKTDLQKLVGDDCGPVNEGAVHATAGPRSHPMPWHRVHARPHRAMRAPKRPLLRLPQALTRISGVHATLQGTGVRVTWNGGTPAVAYASYNTFTTFAGRRCAGSGGCVISGIGGQAPVYVLVIASSHADRGIHQGLNTAVVAPAPESPAAAVPETPQVQTSGRKEDEPDPGDPRSGGER
jgi:hypothetical protein